MKKELKVRINDSRLVEKNLLKFGAIFLKKDKNYYTYLNQAAGMVLKITKNNDGLFKSILQAKNDEFEILENIPIDKNHASSLEKEFGVKRRMENMRQFYEYQNMIITLNSFPDIGNFLIIESEKPSIEFIKNNLDIKNPVIITASFDNL